MFRKSLCILTLIFLVLIFLVACQQTSQELPLPTITVDRTLQPARPSLPGFEEGDTRPVATLKDDAGNQTDFVENELLLSTDDETELDNFVSRWQGKVIYTIDPAEAKLNGLKKMYVVRVNVSGQSTDKLSDNLRQITKDSTGNLMVSSLTAQQLFAAASQEKVSGLDVSMNWIGQQTEIKFGSTSEAPDGDNIRGDIYRADSFEWLYLNAGSVQDIGVANAWRALELAGKFSNKIKIAVIDGGFQDNRDLPPGWEAISSVPFINPINKEGVDSSKAWHGNSVAVTAAGLPDNNWGSAGPAGPVADLILVYTYADIATSISSLLKAKALGAKIVNMSYQISMHFSIAWLALPLELTTKLLRESGVLIFAGAGNDGKNVERESCFIGCVETTWHVPCEQAGVICVGGLDWNSKNRDANSNFSSENDGDDDGDVELYAPYTVWIGSDPQYPDNYARKVSGTSFSSPFAAGVAALIWAADPSLSADDVEAILKETAHDSPDATVKKYINAAAAVYKVLGNVPPDIQITAPGDTPVNVDVLTPLSATVIDLEDGSPCCEITWSSDVEGVLGTGREILYRFTSMGPRTLTVTAKDSQGGINSVRKNIGIINTPPVVTITSPYEGQELYRDVEYVFRATSYDINETNLQLDASQFTWGSSEPSDAFPRSGNELKVTFNSNGERQVGVTGFDSHGRSDSKVVLITVVDPPRNLPPVVNITQPPNGLSISPDTVIQLAGTATDPEGGAVTLSWEVSTRYDPDTGSSTQTYPVTPVANGNWKPTDSIPYGSCEVEDTLRLRLKATDPQGVEGTDFVVISVIRIC